MKTLLMVRTETGDEGTFSGCVGEGGFYIAMGELPWRDNAHDVSCIPCGEYECVLEGPHVYGGDAIDVYRLAGVPGRTGVLIHPANWCGDVAKGWKSELEGCLAPGLDLGALRTKLAGRGVFEQRGVLNSKTALNTLIGWAGERFRLKIVSECEEKFEIPGGMTA